MADEETVETPQEEPERATYTDRAPELPIPSDPEEAKRAMEEAKQARLEKQRQELAEYEEMRRAEREKEYAEIAALKEKRVQRAKEREEEEKKWAVLRSQEEARRKADDEERRRKKQEEEKRNKEDRDRKKREAEERLNKPKGPNFVITKRSDAEKLDSVMSKEELQKSKEQLEEEKRAILSQRIQPLTLEGMDASKLLEKARELQEHIRRLEGDKYDLEQRYKRQQYDMIELAERARQMNKGKGKRGVSAVQVDESFDRLADKFTGAPPKIQLCSKYERHTDHRTYVERKVLFEDLAKEPPPPEIQHVRPVSEGGEQEEAAVAAEAE
ncbi:troponin T, skeletal muscle-like isoform X5 [Pomacea canaliculata]|uniref:troponin T, skeletal muscle-like isoform X5 n=1 Tax=Pomacea canaliculata TaxID=400727 RepID=UPI000D72CA4B|nr:troponin T, skeletal muscle-like isoform X5 [Pomacea canaliculata]